MSTGARLGATLASHDDTTAGHVARSAAHGIADVDLDDPNFEHTEYNERVAYGRSKSANALHALALASRVAYDGVVAYAETKRAQVVLAKLFAEELHAVGDVSLDCCIINNSIVLLFLCCIY